MTKQAAYRERVAAGRRVFHIELSTVAVEEMLGGLGYLDAVTEYTKRECDEALAHTNASILLVADGLDVLTVSRRLGHRDASITLRVYGHLLDKQDKPDKLAAVLG